MSTTSVFDECGAVRGSGGQPCVRRRGHEAPPFGASHDPDDELHQPDGGGEPWREIKPPRSRWAGAIPEVVAASRSIVLPFTATAVTGHLVTVEPASRVRSMGRMVPTVRVADRLLSASGALELSVAICAAIRGVRREAGGALRRCSRTVRALAGGGPIQVRPFTDSLVFVGVWRFEHGDALLLAAALAAAVHRPLRAGPAVRLATPPRHLTSVMTKS